MGLEDRGRSVLIVAGESSGDACAAEVARELRSIVPESELVGTGGACMSAAGVELVANLDLMAVAGFAELLPHLDRLRELERRLLRIALDSALVVLVDYAGLNLRLAADVRAASRKPILYYIPPKVWAWRPKRAHRLAKLTDCVASTLPFEPEFLARYGVQATFVGHPLLDRDDRTVDRASFCRRWKLEPDRPILALLPGSRLQEVRRHFATFRMAAEIAAGSVPGLQSVVGRPPGISEAGYRAAMEESRPVGLKGVEAKAHPVGSHPRPPVITDVSSLLRHARAGIVKSGSVTLECAMAGLPHVVAYRMAPVSWRVVHRRLTVERVSLPNLLAGRTVVPEFIQHRMTASALADAVVPLLAGEDRRREAQLEGFREVRARLGPGGAAKRVAHMACELMTGRTGRGGLPGVLEAGMATPGSSGPALSEV